MSNTELATKILDRARAAGLKVATAESCTGGMISAALTDIAGSSDVFDRGFVTYSNEAKQQMLGVKAETLQRNGAVSAEAAAEMAFGALDRSDANVAVSVTGIAGPGGGSAEKPVGLVWFGAAASDRPVMTEVVVFPPHSRDEIRTEAVKRALRLLLRVVETF